MKPVHAKSAVAAADAVGVVADAVAVVDTAGAAGDGDTRPPANGPTKCAMSQRQPQNGLLPHELSLAALKSRNLRRFLRLCRPRAYFILHRIAGSPCRPAGRAGVLVTQGAFLAP